MINNRQASPAQPRQVEDPRNKKSDGLKPSSVTVPRSRGGDSSATKALSRISSSGQGRNRTMLFGAIALIVIIILAVVLIGRSSVNSQIEGDKYQAVFFTNGQVYFGKLSQVNKDFFKLTDTFYLQTKGDQSSSDDLQQSNSTTSGDIQLIKMGDEIHGPKDEMVISASQVLFFENLKADGKVTTSINQYNEANKD